MDVVEYLEDPLSKKTLTEIVRKLDCDAEELVRKGEDVFKKKYKGKDLSHKEWIAAIAADPKLLQRPIAVKGNKAVVGRPPENVLDLL